MRTLLVVLWTAFFLTFDGAALADRLCSSSSGSSEESPVRKWVRFHASFDENVAADGPNGSSIDPVVAPGSTARYMRGRVGSALQIGGPAGRPDHLTYRIAGRQQLAATGSMSFWVAPIVWGSAPGGADYVPFIRIQGRDAMFLVERDRRAPGAAREKLIAGLFSTRGGSSYPLIVTLDTIWGSGQWHLIVVNWDETGFALSIDGRPEIRRALPVGTFARTFDVERPGASLIVGNKARDSTALDELKLYGVDLVPAEIDGILHDGCASF